MGLELTAETELALLDLIREWTEVLAARVGSRYGTLSEQALLRLSSSILDRMTEDYADALRDSIRLTAERTAEIHAEAATELMASSSRTGIEVAPTGVDVAATQAVLSRDVVAEAMVTIRDAVAEKANRWITESILRGRTSDELAMGLRAHIVGADAIPDRLLADRRTIGQATLRELGMDPSPENVAQVREDAADVAWKSRRIARTEIMNAEHEAGVRFAAESPVVDAIEWTLSSRHPVFDVCDVLAGTTGVDMYGLGPGFYPPDAVPARPHPNCLCGRVHRIRDPSEWGEPRPAPPPLAVNPETAAEEADLPPSSRRMVGDAVAVGVARYRAAEFTE